MTGIYLFDTEVEHLSEEEFIHIFSTRPDALSFLYGVMQRVAELESSLIDLGIYDPTDSAD